MIETASSPGKGRLSGQHLVEERPERVEVALRAGGLTERLLRGQVGDGSDQRPSAGRASGPPWSPGRSRPSRARPSSSIQTFAGLMSRWTIPSRVERAPALGHVGCDLDRALDVQPAALRRKACPLHVVPPGMKLLTMNGLPSCSPVSRTVTTWALSPSFRIASASRRGPRLNRRADALGVEQGHGPPHGRRPLSSAR